MQARALASKTPACIRIFIAILGMMAACPAVDAVSVRVATFNVEHGVGTPGDSDYNAVRDILMRVNSDIIAFQELKTADRANWELLAGELGYTNSVYSDWTSMAGNLYLGYFSRYPIVSTHSVRSPSGANEISRPPFRAVIDVPDAAVPLVLWTLHHKAMDSETDEFRRAIESYRCAEDIGSYLAANPTHQEYVVLGDMNDDVSQYQTSLFWSMPSGLPTSYLLGSDISFPVLYATFPSDAYEVAGSGMVMLNPYQTGTSNPGTLRNSNGRLDYIFVSTDLAEDPSGMPLSEVYNSRYDNNESGLPKTGSPLPGPTSTNASDHYLLFADINMTAASSMVVTPTTGIQPSGLQGGPFSPSSWTYAITNPTADAIDWGLEYPPWLMASPTGGTLEAGAAVSLSLELSVLATLLSEGSYSDLIRITEHSSGAVITRQARLDVLPVATLEVSPNEIVSFNGQPGGPYSPGIAYITLTNSGFTDLEWSGSTSYPVESSPVSGMLAPGAAMQVQLSIASTATNLPLGINTYSIGFTNVINGRGSTNIQVRVVVVSKQGLNDDVESVEPGWTASGLWHASDIRTSSCAKAKSGNRSWWYGSESTCSYDTGQGNSGNLTSPDFIVPDAAFLTYWSWEQTEGYANWDTRIIQISTNIGESWTTVYQSGASESLWRNVAVDLSGYASKVARLRFVFDTIDGQFNNYAGWYIDDIRVQAAGNLHAEPGAIRFEGSKGGLFTPPTRLLLLTNNGVGPLTWTISNLPVWAMADETSGYLEPNSDTAVAVMLTFDAITMEGGLYASQIVIRNTMNNASTNLLVELLVRDSLPDDWRMAYFGHIDPRGDDLSRDMDDRDGDGYTNWDEYVSDTNPMDEGSYFSSLTGIQRESSGGMTMIELRNTSTNRLYDLYMTEGLGDTIPWMPMELDQTGSGGQLWLQVTNGPGVRFYRGGVKLP